MFPSGSALFLRSRGGVVPTDIGRLYIERARDLLRMADELDREAVTHGTLGAGRVAVGGGPYPAESILAPAAVRFVEAYPRISVQLDARDWDELLRQLRSRELDFFVAETSTLQREPDLEIVPMPSAHAVYLVARAGHPLAQRDRVTAVDALPWPFATPGRIPPRILDPMLAAHRAASQRSSPVRPFPSIQCNGLAPVKRILATSDAVTGSILSCISTELEAGQFVLLVPDQRDLKFMPVVPGPCAAKVGTTPPRVSGRKSPVLDKDMGRIEFPETMDDSIDIIPVSGDLEPETRLLDHDAL